MLLFKGEIVLAYKVAVEMGETFAVDVEIAMAPRAFLLLLLFRLLLLPFWPFLFGDSKEVRFAAAPVGDTAAELEVLRLEELEEKLNVDLRKSLN